MLFKGLSCYLKNWWGKKLTFDHKVLFGFVEVTHFARGADKLQRKHTKYDKVSEQVKETPMHIMSG